MYKDKEVKKNVKDIFLSYKTNIFLLGLRRGIKSREKTKAPRKIVDDFGRYRKS